MCVCCMYQHTCSIANDCVPKEQQLRTAATVNKLGIDMHAPNGRSTVGTTTLHADMELEKRPGLRCLGSHSGSHTGVPAQLPLQDRALPLQVVNFVHVNGVSLVGHDVKEEAFPAGATRHAAVGS